jgi:hypothetical protein
MAPLTLGLSRFGLKPWAAPLPGRFFSCPVRWRNERPSAAEGEAQLSIKGEIAGSTASRLTGRFATAIALAIWTTCFLVVAMPVEAHRAATPTESEQMWQAVYGKYGSSDCVEHRGQISTAHTPKRKYGTVVISDSNCGNGQVVLAQPRNNPNARWQALGSGSDWGYPGRCASDLRRIPRKVLQDFFGPNTCSPPLRKCRSPLIYAPKDGGWGLIIVFLRVHGVSCGRALKIGGAYSAGDPMPSHWSCQYLTIPGSWTSCRYKLSKRRFKFVFDGDAG